MLNDQVLGYKASLGVGFFYKVELEKNLSIQPEINYAQHGTKKIDNSQGMSFKNVFKFNYLQIPIFLKYHFSDFKGLIFFIEGAPYVGFGLGKGKVEGCYNGDCNVKEVTFGNSDEDNYKNPDFGIQIGGGVNINSHLSFDFRYLHGLQNLVSKAHNNSNDFIKNTAFNIGIGYSF